MLVNIFFIFLKKNLFFLKQKKSNIKMLKKFFDK